MSSNISTISIACFSPLLTLPGELRNRIYENHFAGIVEVEDGEQIVAQNCDNLRVYIRLGEDIFPMSTLMRLAQTSHQLRFETATFASQIRKFFVDKKIHMIHQMRFIKAELGQCMVDPGDGLEVEHVDLEKKEQHQKEIWITPGLEKVAMVTVVVAQMPLPEKDLRSIILAASKARKDGEAFEKVRRESYEWV